jgi:cytochrome c oxidase subunit III
MSNHTTAHAAHWEMSVWPLVLSVAILFILPFAFILKFVYHQPLLAALSLGIGAPLAVAGIVGWVREAIGGEHGEGLSPAAMGWFILAEAMIFISFFAAYWFMRLTAPNWPPTGTVDMPTVLPAVMTVALVTSSFTIHFGEERLAAGDRAGFVNWLLVTMLLGLTFLGMSGYEWNHLIHLGFTPETNVYSTSFFSITGFHGAHVLVGLGIFVAVLLPALRRSTNDAFVKTASLYWHFVDIIWLFVVSQIYYW